MISCDTCEALKNKINWKKDTFLNIKKVIIQLKNQGELEELGSVSPGSPFLCVKYRCSACGAVWSLTHPDQAFIGSFKRDNK